MAHVRTQIREAVKAILDVEMATHKVFKGRRFNLNSSELPIIDMRFLNENSNSNTMGNVLDRDASLYVRVTRSGTEDEVDALLDDDAVVIEEAMDAADNDDLGGLVKFITLKQTNFTDNADGDKTLAEIVLRFDIGYRTATDNSSIARA